MKFNLPAPASVEWYRSGVPGGGQKDAIFNRVKAKLIGGTDDSGTSYFKMHDRQLSGSDADKIIANMKQDEDGYPMLQTGSTSGEAEREYQEWLIDRYLVSPPPSNTTAEDPGPKDVEVELQVVEIPAPPPESDKPEPLRVTVEAPFVAKKYIKLPRRRTGGIFYRGATKEVDTAEKVSTAQRMGEAFESNLLGPLIKSIQDPDENTTPAKKREVVRTLVSRKQRASAITVGKVPQGDNLAEFLGAKIGQSFKMAAQARRADKGLAKEPMFYLGKALKNQFGGDLVNRTKGYLSANPDDTQDPALSRSQRFAATVKPYMNEQGPLPPPVQGPQRTGIPGAFDRLAAQFDELIALRKQKAEQSKVANEIQQIEVKEATEEIKENNELKKKSVEIKKEFIAFSREQQGDAEILEVETTAEERDPMGDTSEIDNRRGDEDKDGEDDGDDDGGGGDEGDDGGPNFRDFLDIGETALDLFGGRGASVGRRGATRVVRRTALRLGGKRLAQSALARGAQTAVTRVATGISSRAVVGFLRPIFKRIPIVGGLIDFVVSLALGEPVGRAAAKAIGSTLGAALGSLIPIPGVGTIAGGIVGDLVGGAIYDAVTGGTGSAPPSPRDEADASKREALSEADSTKDMSAGEREALVTGTRLPDAGGSGSIENVPDDLNDPLGLRAPTKLASGGIMAGEAGPESVFSLSSTEGRKVVDQVSSVQNTSMSALPFILGIVSQVTEAISGPVKPYIQQEIGTLERLFGIASFNVTKVVGKGVDAVKSVGQKVGINIPGSGKDGSKGVDPQETMTGADAKTTNVTGIPLGEGNTAQAAQLLAGLTQRGFSKEEAAAIVGNLWAESGFKTGARNPSSGAYGLMQWLGGRQDKLIQFAQQNGKEVTDVNLQLDYIAWELRGGNAYETAQFQKAMAYGDTVQDKTRGFAYEVERAGAGELASSMPKRVGAAESAYNGSAGAAPPNAASTPPTPPTTNPTSTNGSNNGGHTAANPGPIAATPPPAPNNPDRSTMTPPGPIQPQKPPAKVVDLYQQAEDHDFITIQPIVYEGGGIAGYQKNVDTGEGIAQFYFDKTGQKTTLADLKAARLQTN